MAKIAFYCRNDRATIEAFEYYKQDLDAFRELGHEIVVCTRYREIPFDADLLYVWWWTYALVPVLFARLAGRPVIVTGVFNFWFPQGFDGKDYFRRPRWQQWLIGLAARLASANLFLNEHEWRACSAFLALRKAYFFPCVVHPDYLLGPGNERQLALFNLAWTGRANLERKGIPDLIEALKILKDRGLVVRTYLAGHAGDGDAFLRELIIARGLGDSVTHLGPLPRDKKIALLRSCEVYVQPSRYEGFGLAIAEAMGSGACIVTCDVGAVRSVVGDAGLYVSPGAPDQLADALERVLGDYETRRTFAERALLRAQEQFTSNAKVTRLKEILADLGVRT